jgi:arabinofuranosyltransferase
MTWRPSSPRICSGVVLCLAAAACIAGWKLFWFLTDDAYIAFRYVSNHQLGHGYTWNPAPFRPVEGYTSFLWLVLLDAVWSLTGTDPPHSANVLSLLASLGSLALLALWAEQGLEFTRAWERPCWLALTLALVVSNRNFLVWSSSGMETALFNLWVLVWLYCVFAADARPARYASLAAVAALLIGLTRPDGLLFAGATVALVALLHRARRLSVRQALSAIAPLAGVAAHVLWRRAYYGAWLPNTYYAKVGQAHPDVGVRFFAAFALEYGLWIWALVMAWWAVHHIRDGYARPIRRGALVGAGTLLLHVAYYVLIVGGDHFEFRVFSHLAVPVALTFILIARRLCKFPVAVGLTLAFGALANAIPWTHWAQTHALVTREQTFGLRVPVAPALPAPLRPLARPFDELQHWLITRGVGVRHQEHKVFLRSLVAQFPSRDVGAATAFRQPLPVMVATWVGIPGWTLPHVYVIDFLGLNDYVIARTPLDRRELGYMAHERRPPPGYLGSFQPNIVLRPGGQVTELPRSVPLTAASVREIEARYAEIVDAL